MRAALRHRRAPRWRRVRGPHGGRDRCRGPRSRRPHPAPAEPPGHGAGLRDRRVGKRRRRRDRRARRREQRADAQRRHRDVQRQDRRQGSLQAVRGLDAQQGRRTQRAPHRPPPRTRTPRDAGVLPTDRRARLARGARLRSARALAPSRARHDRPDRVHQPRRADRTDRRDRRVRARGGVPPARRVGPARHRAGRTERERQRLGPPARRARSRRNRRTRYCGRPASNRRGSRSSSPRACCSTTSTRRPSNCTR